MRNAECGVRNKNRGSAVVVALFVFSLAVIVATSMTDSQNFHIRRATNVLDGDQAYLYTLSLEETVKYNLLEDLKGKKDKEKKEGEEEETSSQQVDHLEERWAKKIDTTDDPTGAKLTATVTDMGSCFNLNSVGADEVGRDQVAVFKRLLQTQGTEQNDVIAASLVDWIDSDRNPESSGAEDEDYLEKKPGFRTANELMKSKSELRPLKGMTGPLFKKILPFVCALPETGTKINVNTAPIPILMALAPGISKSDAESLIEGRKQKKGEKELFAYENVGDFLKQPVFTTGSTKRPPNEKILDVKSNYFLMDARAKVGRGEARLVSLLKRDEKKKEIKVLWRSWGE